MIENHVYKPSLGTFVSIIIDDRLGRLPRYDALGTGLETEVRASKLVLRCY